MNALCFEAFGAAALTDGSRRGWKQTRRVVGGGERERGREREREGKGKEEGGQEERQTETGSQKERGPLGYSLLGETEEGHLWPPKGAPTNPTEEEKREERREENM